MPVVNHLGYWDRILIAGGASAFVVVVLILVLCFVNRECWAYKSYFSEDRKKRKKPPTESDRILNGEPQLVTVKHPSITVSTTPELQPLQFSKSSSECALYYGGSETTSILKSLAAKSDSTYSSMSENSGRSSPTNSCRSSAEGSLGSTAGSNAGSPTGGDAQGQISFAVQFVVTNKERATGKLIIDVKEAHGLPGRQYMGGACDPYVKVLVNRTKRSLRRVNMIPLQVYRTRTVRHTTEPKFDQSFAMEVSRLDLKDIVIKLVAMDSDKWVSSTTLGEVVQPLRDMKNLGTNCEKIPLNFFISPSKVDYGEIFFSLSYLPTAQRLSVSVMKATRLRFTNVVDNISEFHPFVRAILINSSGKVLRKKKTTARINTDKPVWNETLIFDLAQHKLDQVTFILAVCSRPQGTSESSISESEVSVSSTVSTNGGRVCPMIDKKQDRYLGKVILGLNVTNQAEKAHWESVLVSPRKAISQWHILK